MGGAPCIPVNSGSGLCSFRGAIGVGGRALLRVVAILVAQFSLDAQKQSVDLRVSGLMSADEGADDTVARTITSGQVVNGLLESNALRAQRSARAAAKGGQANVRADSGVAHHECGGAPQGYYAPRGRKHKQGKSARQARPSTLTWLGAKGLQTEAPRE